MKYTPAFSLLFSIFSLVAGAQISHSDFSEGGGAYPLGENDADHPCITSEQYEQLEYRCNKNAEALGLPLAGQTDQMMATPLNWPLRAANGLNDCKFYGISAYVDQNTATGAVADYNCGAKTYDAHKGTDISIWPFPFYKMDHNQVEVIAAAAGTIVDKLDGNFDKNCAANNLNANYLVVQHADGSRVLYFHMKQNSLTSKTVGQTVSQGEFLGVVGSSGNSSGPHLHFEVWSGSTVATRIDPYSGPCNTLNANSWWAAQNPYAGPEILKTSVHTTDADIPACPATETPNEADCFTLPFQGPGLPAGAAKFYIFMRYETAGMTTNLSILKPDSTVFTSWTYTSTSNFNASYKSWTKTLPVTPGRYTFRSELNGVVCTKAFDILSPTITASGPTTFCLGGTVTLTAATAGSYLWSNGAITPSITVMNAGNYTVTLTGSNGCTAVSNAVSVTVMPSPVAPTITANGPTTLCQGASVTLTASMANSYSWSNGASSQSISVSNSGSYKVTVANANGCTAVSAPTVITINPLPVAGITANGPTTFCQGASVTLTANAANTYSWSNGATIQTITVSNSGSYTVIVSNSGGCTAVSAPTVVTVNPLPVAGITANGPTTFCQGASVTLTANAANTYSWSNGATTQAITVSNSGSYTVMVSSSGVCTAVSSPTVVTVNPLPVAGITSNGPTTFCQGASVTLTANAANTYSWSNGATTQTITVSNSGSYTVMVSNSSGCTAVSAPTVVTVNTLPVAGITANGSTTFCQGASVTLTANAANTYSWSNGATTQTITVSNSGSYTVIVSNSGGCTAVSAPTVVTVNPLPVAGITANGPTTFCQGASVTLTANAANTYSWSNGATTQAITISNSGSYTVIVSNSGGCTAVSAPTVVTVNSLPVAGITANGPTTFCQGASVTLTANAANTYSWSNGATTQTITVSNSGNYTVKVSNSAGCTSVSAPSPVTVNPLPPAPGISANGALLSSTSPSGNQWYLNGNPIPNATGETFNATQNGDYTVVVTDANGCFSSSAVLHFVSTGVKNLDASYSVEVYPNPNGGIFTVGLGSESMLDERTMLEVYDILGAKVFTGVMQGVKMEVDISNQQAGAYYLKASGSKWICTIPILKN